MGRSHRSAAGKARLHEVIERSRALLELPDSHRIGIVPASDTGAVEMALWSLLGPRGVDMLAWESFGRTWVTDVTTQLGLEDVRVLDAPYGALPDLSRIDFSRDVVLTWNGTTSGVRVPDGKWIAPDRDGLVIVDATSAAFVQEIPWDRVDVATYSWQKVLGGEAAHGMLILGPRAVERLESHTPQWPVPKVFRLTKGRAINDGIFMGATINTPSMLCVEDCLDALAWAERQGGLEGLRRLANANLAVMEDWVERTEWVDFLAREPRFRSNTSVCLSVVDSAFKRLSPADQAALTSRVVSSLAEEGVGYDLGSYRDAPPGLRIWCGPTVVRSDLEALLPWIDWAYRAVTRERAA